MDQPVQRALPRWTPWAATALVVAACLAVFGVTFSAGLVNWDDEPGIVRNHAFRGLDGEHLAWMFTTNTLGHYQPLSWLSLAVDHSLFGLTSSMDAPQAGRFHLTSVALHALTALLFLGLGASVLRRALPRAGPRAIGAAALFAALFFAVHPLRAESVAWLTERRDVLSGLFFVGAVWAWWGGVERSGAPAVPRTSALLVAALGLAGVLLGQALLFDLSDPMALGLRTGWPLPAGVALIGLIVCTAFALRIHPALRGPTLLRGLAVVLAALSLLAKAWGIVLPALLLLLDVWPLARWEAAGVQRWKRALALILEKAPFIALAVVAARLATWAQASQPGTMLGLEAHTLSERTVQALYGLAWYPLKTLLPIELSPYVEVPPEVSLLQPRFALAAGLVLAGVALLLVLRRRVPGLLAAGLAFVVIVSPVLGLLQSGPQLVADRYSYLAGLPLALLAAGTLAGLALRNAALVPGLVLLGAIWLVPLGVAGQRQAAIWRNSESLWSHALAVDPHNARAAQKLVQAWLAEGGTASDAAARHAAALELLESLPRPDDPGWLATYAQALLERARLEPRRRTDDVTRAVELCRRAVALQEPAVEPEQLLNLGSALIEAGRPQLALEPLRRYLAARPTDAVGWANLGVALAAAGRAGEALEPLRRSVALDPSYAKGWKFLAQACEQAGDTAGAREAWQRLLELWPNSEQARARLRALGR